MSIRLETLFAGAGFLLVALGLVFLAIEAHGSALPAAFVTFGACGFAFVAALVVAILNRSRAA